MEKLKYFKIVIDGIDKTGKDLIKSYIWYVGKKRYLCYARGVLSEVAYAHLYGRDVEYLIPKSSEERIVNVLLTADKDDWEIRCKTTNEPLLDYDAQIKAFKYAKEVLSDKLEHLIEINTSNYTPYQTAKIIVDYINKLNNLKS